MKILPADVWFGRCVKERVGWTCEKCGKVYNIPDTQGLHCSHFITRKNYAVRFEPLNAFTHCYFCHMTFEGNPHKFVAWAREKLGGDLYDLLIEKSNDIDRGRMIRRELKDVARHYESEHNRMLSIRAEGINGRIEFTGY
jgi:hypothetical protein